MSFQQNGVLMSDYSKTEPLWTVFIQFSIFPSHTKNTVTNGLGLSIILSF